MLWLIIYMPLQFAYNIGSMQYGHLVHLLVPYFIITALTFIAINDEKARTITLIMLPVEFMAIMITHASNTQLWEIMPWYAPIFLYICAMGNYLLGLHFNKYTRITFVLIGTLYALDVLNIPRSLYTMEEVGITGTIAQKAMPLYFIIGLLQKIKETVKKNGKTTINDTIEERNEQNI